MAVNASQLSLPQLDNVKTQLEEVAMERSLENYSVHMHIPI